MAPKKKSETDAKATPSKAKTRKPRAAKAAAAKKPAAKKPAKAAAASKAAKATPRKRASSAGKNGSRTRKVAATDRIAIIGGLRTPFVRAWTTLNDVDPVQLSTQVARELLFKLDVDPRIVNEIVWGTVISVVRAPNVAREVALNLDLYHAPGFTVSRACATGFQSVASAAQLIGAGQADIVLAGGVDVTSHAPVVHKKKVIDLLQKAQKAKGVALVQTIAGLNPLDLLPTPPALTERYTGLTMGQHAELMAQHFDIPRKEQEDLAVTSHSRAHKATEAGWIADEMMTVHTPKGAADADNLIRPDMKPEKLAKLRPVFDRKNGTITAATSSPLTDGAACVLVMRESKAKELGYTPRAFVRGYNFAALDPRENMLLGNVYSVPGALDRAGVGLGDMDAVEIHEAFAAQVLSNLRCMASKTFFEEKLGRSEPLGEIDRDKLNIWGGSMAYGHPFAATGCRMITQLIDELEQVDGQLGLATACAAGGMGAAMVLERN